MTVEEDLLEELKNGKPWEKVSNIKAKASLYKALDRYFEWVPAKVEQGRIDVAKQTAIITELANKHEQLERQYVSDQNGAREAAASRAAEEAALKSIKEETEAAHGELGQFNQKLDGLKTRGITEDILEEVAASDAEDAEDLLFRVRARARIFSHDVNTMRDVFLKQRKNLARKLQNPRLNQIHFHTFRHWKATTLYHKTKDLLYVQRFLGHRSISNTMKYIQLEESIFKENVDEYICKAAKTIQEASDYIEQGYTYVCDVEDAKLFRKPK